MLSFAVLFEKLRQGLLPEILQNRAQVPVLEGATSRVTMAPEAITAPLPSVTSGLVCALWPIKALRADLRENQPASSRASF